MPDSYIDSVLENAEIKIIRREDVRPGDVIVIEMRGKVRLDQWRAMADSLKRVFPGHETILLEDGARIAICGKDEIRA